MTSGENCQMHKKAPVIAGAAVVLFNLLGLYVAPILLWVTVIVGALLIYAGLTGNCMISKLLDKHCADKKDGTGTP